MSVLHKVSCCELKTEMPRVTIPRGMAAICAEFWPLRAAHERWCMFATGLAAAACKHPQDDAQKEGGASHAGQLGHAQRLDRAAAPRPRPARAQPPAQRCSSLCCPAPACQQSGIAYGSPSWGYNSKCVHWDCQNCWQRAYAAAGIKAALFTAFYRPGGLHTTQKCHVDRLTERAGCASQLLSCRIATTARRTRCRRRPSARRPPSAPRAWPRCLPAASMRCNRARTASQSRRSAPTATPSGTALAAPARSAPAAALVFSSCCACLHRALSGSPTVVHCNLRA